MIYGPSFTTLFLYPIYPRFNVPTFQTIEEGIGLDAEKWLRAFFSSKTNMPQ